MIHKKPPAVAGGIENYLKKFCKAATCSLAVLSVTDSSCQPLYNPAGRPLRVPRSDAATAANPDLMRLQVLSGSVVSGSNNR